MKISYIDGENLVSKKAWILTGICPTNNIPIIFQIWFKYIYFFYIYIYPIAKTFYTYEESFAVLVYLKFRYDHITFNKLDESTARRQLKSPRSLSGTSIHLTLTPNGHGHDHEWPTPTPFVMSIGPPILRYSYLKIWPWKSMVRVRCVVKGQGHGYGQGHTHWSNLRPGVHYRKFHIWPWKFKVKVMAKVKPDGHIWGLGVRSISLLFVSWQSDHFWLRYSKLYIGPWKLKVKVMAKVKPDGHIWALEFNRYVCFLFRGNRTIFGSDIANSIFDLENSRSRSRQKSPKI